VGRIDEWVVVTRQLACLDVGNLPADADHGLAEAGAAKKQRAAALQSK
jgi:hypothetical protein